MATDVKVERQLGHTGCTPVQGVEGPRAGEAPQPRVREALEEQSARGPVQSRLLEREGVIE